MINFEKYTEDTYNHVPRGYQEESRVLMRICDRNNDRASACVMDGWKLGFERAYRAAKAGKLDFQRQNITCPSGNGAPTPEPDGGRRKE